VHGVRPHALPYTWVLVQHVTTRGRFPTRKRNAVFLADVHVPDRDVEMVAGQAWQRQRAGPGPGVVLPWEVGVAADEAGTVPKRVRAERLPADVKNFADGVERF